MMSEIYGENASEPYAEYDPSTHCLRTYQLCLLPKTGDSSTAYLQTWRAQGIMLNGKLYQRVPLVRHIHGKECGLLPTPTKADERGERHKETEFQDLR